jgi:lipid-binding SYLF domain-containing protein
MKSFVWPVLGLLVLGTAMSGCSTAPPSTDDRQTLIEEANSALNKLEREDAGLRAFLDRSAGYAIFPAVGKGGVIVGGAFGRGIVYERGVTGFNRVGYTKLEQATVGAQLGGQSYAELIVFETRTAFERFINGDFAFSANASAVALKAGASAAAKYENGVAIFTMPNGGAMLEASIGGQRFKFTRD